MNNPNGQLSFEQAKKFILSHQTFLLATHARTDGDDCGSMLAFFSALKMLDKNPVMAVTGGVPPLLRFLPNQNEVGEIVPNQKFDAIILFGCSFPERTELNLPANTPILNIDHHKDNKIYGAVNLVEPKKSSVAELVYDFFKYCELEINADIAKCLLTGILTDTGSFMHSNTTATTLNAAAELMKRGARIDKIYNSTYSNKDLSSLRAWGFALERTKVYPDNKVAVCVLTAEDLKFLEPLDDDTFMGFVEILNTISGTKFSVFMRQDGEYVKGSMRSEEHKNVDVSKIAKALAGGGGHKLAAGFKFKGTILRQPDGNWNIK